MRRVDLSLSAKLVFLALPLAFPLVLLVWLYGSERQSLIDFAEQEIRGLDLLDSLVDSRFAVLSGNRAPESGASAARALGLGPEYEAYEAVPSEAQFLKLVSDTGDRSNLILDPDIDTYYLMDIAVLRIPRILAAARQALAEERGRRDVIEILMQEQFSAVESALTKARSANPSIEESARLSGEFAAAGSAFFGRPDRDSQMRLVKAGSAFYGAVSKELRSLLLLRIEKLAAARTRMLTLAAFLLVAAIVLGILTAQSIRKPIAAIVARVEELSRGTGDLTLRLHEVQGKESRRLARGVNAFVEHLHATIARIRDESSRVSTGAVRLAGSADVLAGSITNQASASEEAAAALEEITASFDSIAGSTEAASRDIQAIQGLISEVNESSGRANQNLADLARLSGEAALSSTKGREVVEKTRDAMARIQKSAEQISGILTIINAVSDQIDLLALNASIEAARAGEAGRGFAVVAEQIGKLAGSTASGVDQIQNLLNESRSAIAEGTSHVTAAAPVLGEVFSRVGEIDAAAGRILQEIRNQSGRVSAIHERLTQIARMAGAIETAVREQRTASREVLTSIEAMSREIQALAQHGDDVALIGAEMKKGAAAVDGLISGFKVSAH